MRSMLPEMYWNVTFEPLKDPFNHINFTEEDSSSFRIIWNNFDQPGTRDNQAKAIRTDR